MSEEVIRKILEEIETIPALPQVAIQVMHLTRDPDCSADHLTRVISSDQGLTANLLKLCNSAFYGLPRTIGSVKQAIMYLGFHTVRNLVLTSALFDIFREQKEGYGFRAGGLWQHSVATALAAQIIVQRLEPGIAETAFTAGLLHDVGKLILARRFEKQYADIESRILQDGISLPQAEEAVIGCDHAEVGARIADRWKFPRDLILAIACHHEPERAKDYPPLVVGTHIANIIARRNGFGITGEHAPETISADALQHTGLTEDDLREIGAKLAAALEQTAEFVR
jgi:putative nucleotidyltransferase with HDIG domain